MEEVRLGRKRVGHAREESKAQQRHGGATLTLSTTLLLESTNCIDSREDWL